MRADRRIYVNADRSKIVDEGSEEASILLAAEGDDISDEDARRLGLTGKKPKPVAAPVEEAPAVVEDEPKPEGKAVSGPPENKAKSSPDQKKVDEAK